MVLCVAGIKVKGGKLSRELRQALQLLNAFPPDLCCLMGSLELPLLLGAERVWFPTEMLSVNVSW